MKRTRLLAVSTALIGALLLSACSNASTDPAAGSGEPATSDGILRVATQEPTALVPGNSGGFFALSIAETLFSGLVNYDTETGEPVNLVAESIETDDQQTWRIKLKPGWTFQNGEPVDAESFARGWNETVSPANAWVGSTQLAGIQGYQEVNPAEGEPTAETLSGVVVDSDTELTVTLSAPNNQFLYQLAQPAFYPLPQAAIDDPESFATAPIGNGPYQITEPWTGGPEIVTERFEEYGGEKARNGGVTFKIYTGYDVAYRDFQAGEVDITNVLADDLPGATAALGDRLITGGGSNFTYLGLPTWNENYQDPRIRQALSLAIDRQAIIDALLDPTYEPLTDFAVPITTGYRDTDASGFLEYNPERAKQLWDEAGGIDGPLKITVVTGTGRDAWSEAILNQWVETFGLTDASLEFIPSENTHKALLGQEVPNAAALNSPVSNPSPSALLDRAYKTGASSNYFGYANQDFDKLVVDAAAQAAPEDTASEYEKAKDLLLEELPAIPLWSPGSATAIGENIDGYVRDPFNKSPYWQISVS